MLSDKIGKTVYYIPSVNAAIIVETKIGDVECWTKDGQFWGSWDNTPEPQPDNIASVYYMIRWPVGNSIELNCDYDRLYENLSDAYEYLKYQGWKKKKGYRAHKKARSLAFRKYKFIFGTHEDKRENVDAIAREATNECMQNHRRFYTL